MTANLSKINSLFSWPTLQNPILSVTLQRIISMTEFLSLTFDMGLNELSLKDLQIL